MTRGRHLIEDHIASHSKWQVPAGARCILQRLEPARRDDIGISKRRDPAKSGHRPPSGFLAACRQARRRGCSRSSYCQRTSPCPTISSVTARIGIVAFACGMSCNIPTAYDDMEFLDLDPCASRR